MTDDSHTDDSDAGIEPPPRPRLSNAAQKRLQAARLWVAANRPYYSKALFSCPVIPTGDGTTTGIDQQWRIYANSDHIESLTVEQTAAELIHQLNHVLRSHAQRAASTAVTADTAIVWAAAADCEINDDLHHDGLYLKHWVTPWTFALDAYGTAERYYRSLLDGNLVDSILADSGPPDDNLPDDGHLDSDSADAVTEHVGCGSGCDNHRTDYELDPDTAELTDLDRELLRRSVASAVDDHHKQHGPGSVPQGLARWAQQTLRSRVNWRQALAAALRNSVHHKAGTADYTWQRPSRRQQPQDPVVRPAMTRPVPAIAVVVDTSASMSPHELDRALTEVNAIIATVVPGDSVRVLSVDTCVHTDQNIHSTTQLQLAGAGGTDMAAGIYAAAESNPDTIVVVTDGWTPWPATPPPGARTVIAALTHNSQPHNIPKWIQAIDLTTT